MTLEHLRKKGHLALGDVELAWQPGQSTALDCWGIAQRRDVGSVIATMQGQDGQRRDVPYNVTIAFAVFGVYRTGSGPVLRVSAPAK